MAEAAAKKPFVSKFQDYWKFITVLLAIAATTITGYKSFDETRDSLVEADAGLTRAVEGLDKRLASIEESMLKSTDLAGFVGEDTLRQVSCRQTLRAQRHEFLALGKAYEELIDAVKLAEGSFANRELSDPEERQFLAVVQLRSRFESRRRDMEKEVRATEDRIESPEGC